MVRLAFACCLISGLCACVVGDPTPGIPAPTGDQPDAGGDPGPGADAAPQQADCEPVATVIPAGHHNAGQACLTCHDGNTADAPLWTVAGTLYDSATGTAPLPGGTIILTDSVGTTIKLTSGDNGNFFTSQTVVFPVRATASRCPDTQAMAQPQQVGDCNSCHGPASRIHLP
jgi:hypothetical protein